MCGRIALYSDPPRLARLLDAGIDPELVDWQRKWNTAPTDPILGAAENSEGVRTLSVYQWGLVPWWAKDPAIKGTFNARAESVATKRMFRGAFEHGRLLVPADAFYEWQRIDGTRQPYAFCRVDGEPIVFAGLRERWKDSQKTIRTATIITTEAGPDMEEIHDRMPVVLEQGAWDRWLDPNVEDPEELLAMLRPPPAGTLMHYPVGGAVGNVRNDGPGLMDRVELSTTAQRALGI